MSAIKGKVLFNEVTGHLEWWQTTVIYQIYPRSFQDGNGDGVGDFKGIISRLGYFKEIGIETIWLSPFYKTPMKDFGYDISDFCSVDPVFGRMEDFDRFMSEAHAKGLKVVLDYVPNHTSDQHEWFQRSRSEGRAGEYADFYVWHDGKVVDGRRVPPNNWLSVFSGSAWEWDPVRKQYYLHQFVKEQPDLNYRNPRVREEMWKVFEFWLSKGVDGFRIDAIGQLVESEGLEDEPISDNKRWPANEYYYLDHHHTFAHPMTYEIVKSWRQAFEKYQKDHKKVHIFMVTEMYELKQAVQFYDYGVDFPFNFNLTTLNKKTDGLHVYELISSWLELTPHGKWPNWVLGNHDVKRITTKMGEKFADAANGLLLLLPGTPTSYYGEELGMMDITVSFDDTQDPFGINVGKDRYHLVSRDPARSPMQWSADKNAGFSSANKTWLPVHPGFTHVNVEVEKKNPRSHLAVYIRLLAMRKLPVFQKGAMICGLVNKSVFSFVRSLRGEIPYLVVVNTDDQEYMGDFSINIEGKLFDEGSVIIRSGQTLCTQTVDLVELQVAPKELLVVKLKSFPSTAKGHL